MNGKVGQGKESYSAVGGRQLSIKWSFRVGGDKEVTFALRRNGGEEMSQVGIWAKRPQSDGHPNAKTPSRCPGGSRNSTEPETAAITCSL